MNFQVPQFIEIENKIFGPLTFSQFIYVTGGGAIAFLFYIISPNIYIALIPMILSVFAGGMLAFYKINNRSFVNILQSMIKYYTSNKLYLWQQRKPDFKNNQTNDEVVKKDNLPNMTGDKLEKLSWSLNVKEEIK